MDRKHKSNVYVKSEDRQELEKTAEELIRKLPDSVLIKIMEAVKK